MAAGGRAIAAMADVAEAATVEMMVARAEKELGSVTILVNNAGMSWRGTLDTYDPEQVMRMRRVNVEGLIHATRAVIGGMRALYYGRIVNISLIAGIGTALPDNAFYAATACFPLSGTNGKRASRMHHRMHRSRSQFLKAPVLQPP